MDRAIRLTLVCLAANLAAHAGVVQGVVLEHLSGRPLARARVRLDPVSKPGVTLHSLQTRAGIGGQFSFLGVPEGLYILTATRQSYFPAAYGQRRPSGHGMPFQVTKDSDFYTQLQMWRTGAITGRVLDENSIGIEGVPVIAYRARLPLRAAGRGVSDERGFYRVYGLEPGKYWIRTVAHTLDDGSGRLPTFGPESQAISHAVTHEVHLDADTTDADVRPEPGRLFSLGGRLLCDPPGSPVVVTITSETMRRTADAACGEVYRFDGLAPANYEVSAIKRGGTGAAFLEMYLDRPSGAGTLILSPPPSVDFEVRRGGATASTNTPLKLTGHRIDLSGASVEREIPFPRAVLEPGNWEIAAEAGPGQYVESITSFSGPSRRIRGSEPPLDGFTALIQGAFPARVVIVVSDQAGQLAGVVKTGGKPVPGTPVFLWPVAESARRSLRAPLAMLTDMDGQYSFSGLPPGDYRLLATFDLREVEESSFEQAKAGTIHVDPSKLTAADLVLWNAP